MSQSAARKLKRQMMKRALAAKVSVAPPPPAPAATAPDKKPPKMRRLRLAMSDEQMGLLANVQGRLQAAQTEFETVLRVVIAQHHLVEAQLIQILPGRPPRLLVAVPDTKPAGRRKAK